MNGYRSEHYIQSLAEFGTPLYLPAAEGWCLQRPIGDTGYFDAMGAYPLFACRNWAALGQDLSALSPRLVTFTAVCDPLSAPGPEVLEQLFPELCRPFKRHYVAELERPRESIVCKHHQRNVRQAQKQVTVRVAERPADYLAQWCELYGELRERHAIRSMSAFSEQSFVGQLSVPGATLLIAESAGEAVAMQLWYRQGDDAYYHLGASSPRGYELKASFALFWYAFEHFASQGAVRLEFGGAAGVEEDEVDGLARFKRGWCNHSVVAYLCGCVLEHDIYQALSAGSGVAADTGYFPRYRAGEFA